MIDISIANRIENAENEIVKLENDLQQIRNFISEDNAEWLLIEQNEDGMKYSCSQCDATYIFTDKEDLFRYCPKCGCKMNKNKYKKRCLYTK